MQIPIEVKNILAKLQEAGFEAYAVGGCVRDLLLARQSLGDGGLGRKPKDWDIATNALPEQVQQVFPDSFYENKFGTVSVKIQHGSHPDPAVAGEGSEKDSSLRSRSSQNDGNELIDFVEVTTYRVDEKYTDKRHPDAVSFTPNLQEDLARRDFTINAMALGLAGKIIDPFDGRKDLEKGLIRAVGEADKRFGEDALRMLRAVRFAVELSSFSSHPESSADDEGSEKDSSLRSHSAQNDNGGKNKIGVELVPQGSVKQSFPRCRPEPSAGGEESLPTGKAGKKDSSFRSRGVYTERSECAQNDGKSYQFNIEQKTKEAIKKNASWLRAIAKERVRDEFVKIIMSERPDEGVLSLHELGLLEFIIPELEKGFGVAQNKHHIYSIFEHGIFSLKFSAQKNFHLIVRLAALLHDVAKPQAKRGEGENSTFYNHDIMGSRAAARLLERLRFDNETIERVANLIRHHMFVYDVGVVTPASVRRLLVSVGPENIGDLIALRVADRLGSGVPKAQPYRLRHFQYMVERVQNDPISVKMLKINGHDLMTVLQIKPGPKIGAILDVLLAEVIEEPKKNEKDILLARAKQLDKEDLAQLRQMAKTRIEEEKEEEDKVIKGRYWV